MPDRPRLACIVADLRLARIALEAAAAAGADVELWSPPGAAGDLGVGYWAALDRAVAGLAASALADSGRASTVLDCGAAPGHALAALREGLRTLHVPVRADVRPDVRAKLAAIAEQHGAMLHPGPPPELDLRDRLDPAASCRFALGLPDPRS